MCHISKFILGPAPIPSDLDCVNSDCDDDTVSIMKHAEESCVTNTCRAVSRRVVRTRRSVFLHDYNPQCSTLPPFVFCVRSGVYLIDAHKIFCMLLFALLHCAPSSHGTRLHGEALHHLTFTLALFYSQQLHQNQVVLWRSITLTSCVP
jgi:hypothetical protein